MRYEFRHAIKTTMSKEDTKDKRDKKGQEEQKGQEVERGQEGQEEYEGQDGCERQDREEEHEGPEEPDGQEWQKGQKGVERYPILTYIRERWRYMSWGRDWWKPKDKMQTNKFKNNPELIKLKYWTFLINELCPNTEKILSFEEKNSEPYSTKRSNFIAVYKYLFSYESKFCRIGPRCSVIIRERKVKILMVLVC